MVPVTRELPPTCRFYVLPQHLRPRPTAELFPPCPPLQEDAFLGPQSLPGWLSPRSSKCPVLVSGRTLSIAVHGQVGATFTQCERKIYSMWEKNHSSKYSASHCLPESTRSAAPTANTTQSRSEWPAWLGVWNPGPLTSVWFTCCRRDECVRV